MRPVLAILAAGALVAACGGGKEEAAPATSDAAEAAAAVTPDVAAAAGDAAQSSLDASDSKLDTGQYYELAPLNAVEAGENIGFEVNATFKPVLLFVDENKNAIAKAEDAVANDASGWTIRHVQSFEKSGNYGVMVASEEPGATGDYSVAMQRGEGAG